MSESGSLVREIARLRVQRAGQLSQLETTLGNLREGVLLVDRDNYILLANPASPHMDGLIQPRVFGTGRG